MDRLKSAACEAIERSSNELNELSLELWGNPETNFEEFHAHEVLTNFLEERGFNVERKYKLDTAFTATVGSKDNGPHVAVLCEYDALPEIGHACGHNLIAESGVAAGLGIKASFEAAGKPLGKLSIIGTPAEEGGGGKIILIEKGAFSDVDVAMMSHPSPIDLQNADIMIAVQMVKVVYHGKASHAAAFPWEGINALDAAVTCYQSISNLRQQMKPSWRVHGVINNGGTKPNVIPEKTELEYLIRAPKKNELDILNKKVLHCIESAAKATGCTVEHEFSPRPFLNVISNKTLLESFNDNCSLVGTGDNKVDDGSKFLSGGSTDMGNVSYQVPSIHPFFYIGSDAFNHTRDFAKASGDPKAQPYTLLQAKAMALTAIDVFTKEEMLQQIKEDFKKDLSGVNN